MNRFIVHSKCEQVFVEISKHILNFLREHKRPNIAKKSYDKPRQYIKKQRHYFANKSPCSQSYHFPVVMYGCESWTIKAEQWRTDVFELWCCRRLLRVPWTARRSNQSILKEINPEYLLEGLTQSWSSNTSAT